MPLFCDSCSEAIDAAKAKGEEFKPYADCAHCVKAVRKARGAKDGQSFKFEVDRTPTGCEKPNPKEAKRDDHGDRYPAAGAPDHEKVS